MQQPRRILYIDDDAGLRRLVEKLLGRRGHTVVTAATGDDGVARAREGGFDLIAVDHYMPGMDGLETLQALRALPDGPPVVYVTGSEESSVAVAALKAGAAEYVVKSVGDDFVDLLERAFSHALATLRLERAKAEAEEALVASNLRLETLLREVNHRVANSLQLAGTMVGMQARLLPEGLARDALDDTERRIQAIAQVHRRLYASSDVQSVAMDEYLAALVAELEETWSSSHAPRHIRLTAEPLQLEADKALSLGVIVNELVSNACKYAYSPDDAGEIRVNFGRTGEQHFRLCVEDDGRGIELGTAPTGTGLGTRLITAMAKSLGGPVEYDRSHRGVRATLEAAIA
ncbi:response regulator [Sphingomonas ginkgonis]|uniref:histidine kinase n=1 Tax=Sphingomonas ginkgonis TaxID=2315330 RepID=A0A3S0ELL3_9SPHN|nr:response regulator [Sphingomonas ginkgonis]RST30407.1 response regulator [Sphingomonas ginkgonis]